MPPPQPSSSGIARFVPGLALVKGFSPALLRTELIVAVQRAIDVPLKERR